MQRPKSSAISTSSFILSFSPSRLVCTICISSFQPRLASKVCKQGLKVQRLRSLRTKCDWHSPLWPPRLPTSSMPSFGGVGMSPSLDRFRIDVKESIQMARPATHGRSAAGTCLISSAPRWSNDRCKALPAERAYRRCSDASKSETIEH